MDQNETILQLAQNCLQRTPVIVLGSGHSAAYGISGMGPLKEHLLATVTPGESTAAQEAWGRLTTELQELDLEAALQQVPIPRPLLEAILAATRELIVKEDQALLGKVVSGQLKLALTTLYRHLFNSTNRVVTVVTTNYDRLAEYAADVAKYCWQTGFVGQYIRFFGTSGSSSSRSRGRLVEVWKVHGSLDWFVDNQGVVSALPDDLVRPEQMTPLLVTPGTAKYETTHQEPFRTIIQCADAALASAEAYLCIGYGFNDSHIQPKLVERVRHQSIPVVILARTMTDAARAFVTQCCHDGLLALEACDAGTRAYTREYPSGIELPNRSLWQLSEFLDAAVGPT
jgi:hypothetical protein